jgi:hypothetical protein
MLSSDGLPPGQWYSVIVPLRYPSFNSAATLEVNPAESLLRNFYPSVMSDPWLPSSSLSEFLVSFAFNCHAIVLHGPRFCRVTVQLYAQYVLRKQNSLLKIFWAINSDSAGLAIRALVATLRCKVSAHTPG